MNRALSWLLALAIGGVLIYLGGYMKIYAAEFMDDTTSPALFEQIAAVAVHYAGEVGEKMEPMGRYVIGGLEVLVGLMLILPMTRMMGAFLAFCITLGAIATHVAGQFVPEEAFTERNLEPFGLAVVQNGEPNYMLFGFAVLLFVGTIILMRVDTGD